MKRKPPVVVSPDDALLFRDAIGEVRPLETATPGPEKPKPEPVARMHLLDEVNALVESRSASALDALAGADEALAYRRPEMGERAFRQLKRGEYSVQDEIDLHQLRAAQAEVLLKRFLSEAVREGRRCVRIIHGKGLRSENGPVLKALVDRVLRHHGDVLAFSSAPAAQGGLGAALVLLQGGR